MKSRFSTFAFTLFAVSAHAGTLYVNAAHPNCPGDGSAGNPYCTIQAALNAAVNGDVVLVHPGTYVEHVNFLGKSVRLESIQGPAVTAIRPDPMSNLSTVRFVTGEDDGAALVGFDIGSTRGTPNQTSLGNGTAGGAILSIQASPRIIGNWFRFPATVGVGGAIACVGGSPRLHGNRIDADFVAVKGAGVYFDTCTFLEIFDNEVDTLSAQQGGGFFLGACLAPRFERNVIENNTAQVGGGIYLEGNFTVMLDNVIRGNHAETGGGVAILNSNVNCLDDTYLDNSATKNGGGISKDGNGHLSIADLTFQNCSARYGGGLHGIGSGAFEITECEFVGNSAEEGGCGAFVPSGSSNFRRCVFRGHTCPNFLGIPVGALHTSGTVEDCLFHGNQRAIVAIGPGFLVVRRSTFTSNLVAIDGWFFGGLIQIASSILWANGTDTLQFHGLTGPNGMFTVNYSDVMGSYPGTGNINADPQFVAPGDGDFRLKSSSPCIEKGSPTDADCGVDVAESPRRIGATFGPTGLIDQGAHEFSHVSLALAPAAPGFIEIESSGTAGLATMMLVGVGEGRTCVGPTGTLLFDLTEPWVMVPWPNLPSQVSLALPAGPLPSGIRLQQLALGPSGGANLSNAVTLD